SGQVLVQMEDDIVQLQMQQAYSAWQAATAQSDKARKGVRTEELENARALLKQAEKDLTVAEENFKRTEQLYKQGALAKARYEEVERSFQSAQTQVENAKRNVSMMEQGASPEELKAAESNAKALEAQYNLAKLQVDYTRIKAPISGKVAKRFVDEGNMAGQSTPLLSIVQEDPIKIEVPLPEKYYEIFSNNSKNKEGLAVKIYPAAFPDAQPIMATVTAISPTIDPKSRTFTATVDLENKNGELRSGMYANVEFVLERVENAMLVPSGAVVSRNEKTGVFTVHEGSSLTALFTEVEIGLSTLEETHIVSGLKAEAEVIKEGNAFLANGQKVKVLH
ncbi:MAG: efflux RND transporter periplasmic adaptor subunit, partial [Spirochaetota bacterium]